MYLQLVSKHFEFIYDVDGKQADISSDSKPLKPTTDNRNTRSFIELDLNLLVIGPSASSTSK